MSDNHSSFLSPIPVAKLDFPDSEMIAMPTNKRRILYIEDHEDTREMICLVLHQHSYEVVTGASVRSGVTLANQQHFDLYLLDSWLPDGSGVELCRKIREFDSTTPILFYSAAAYEADRTSALESGAQAYLTKPSLNSELCELVGTLIEKPLASSQNRIAVASGRVKS